MNDLSQFENIGNQIEEGAWMDVKHPVTGADAGIRIKVVPYQSERVKKFLRTIANKAAKQQMRNPKKTPTAEEREEQSLQTAMRTVIDWEMNYRGEPFPFTVENVEALFRNPSYNFIVEQVDAFAEDIGNFINP